MTTERQDAPETATPRWAGTPWFVAAGLVVVVAVVMLVTPVGAPARASAPDCGIALSSGDEPAQQTDWCVAARGERVTTSLAVLAIGGFLVVAGLLRRSRRGLDPWTGGGLALLALASTSLWLPQGDDQTDTWCGSALMPSSTAVLSDRPLAECAGLRSTRVAWTLIPAAAGVLLLASRRPARDASEPERKRLF